MRILFASASFGTVPGLRDRLRQRYDVRSLVMACPGRGKPFAGKLGLAAVSARNFVRLLACPAAYDPGTLLITDSAHYPCLLLARLLSALGIRKQVYLLNFYIHGLGSRAGVRRVLGWLIGRNISILVQSPSERGYFRALAPHADIRYFPYCRPPIRAVDTGEIRTGDYVFSGGYTNRDYDTLIAAARDLPDVPFVIVSSRLNRLRGGLPPNVRHLLDIDLRSFQNLLAGSRLVVIPLKENVGASGQMVALAGMQFSKAVVYPDFDTVSQYFVDGISGVQYRAGEADFLRDVIRGLFDDLDRIGRIGAAAHRRWEECFTMDRLEAALLDHIDTAVREAPGAPD